MLHLLFAVSLALSSSRPLPAQQSIARDIHVGRWTGSSRVIQASLTAGSNDPFEAVALSWSAPGGGERIVRMRASGDGREWSKWVTARIDEDLSDPSEGRTFTTIAHFGGARRYVEVSFGSQPGSAAGIEDLTLTVFPPAAPAARGERPAEENLRVGAIDVRSRLDWGCPDGEDSRWTPAYTTVTHAIVHHTDGANSVPDWDAEVRNIWYFHTVTRGWGDIGYNYLIDPDGIIYEGRAGGDGAIGAHFSCRNSNTVGVALLGTYIADLPATAALKSLERLLGELCRRDEIVPTAFAYHPPTELTLPTIAGHRDGNPSSTTCSTTTCPGDALYALLPSIRSGVVLCTPVAIAAQPVSTAIPAGGSATLGVTATGSEPYAYQWYVGPSGDTASPIAGATGETLTISPSTTTSYWIRVSNGCGSVDSATATVLRSWPVRRRASKHSAAP